MTTKHRLLCTAAILCVLAVAAVVLAQGPRRIAFYSTSVNLNSSAGPQSLGIGPGKITAVRQTLTAVLRALYRVQENQISGGPDWVRYERYDIEAIAPPRPQAYSQQETTDLIE